MKILSYSVNFQWQDSDITFIREIQGNWISVFLVDLPLAKTLWGQLIEVKNKTIINRFSLLIHKLVILILLDEFPLLRYLPMETPDGATLVRT